MKSAPLILASASPRRAELLKRLKLEFQIVPGTIAEIIDEQLSPLELCQLNAHRKARVIAKKHPDALVLGADTLVFLDGEIMGKPSDVTEARRMLGRLQGRTHQVVTGVSLIHLRALRERTFAVSTDVTFRPLSEDEINVYLSKMDPLDKAGAYAIQEHGDTIVLEISGSFSNVVGLPMEALREEIQAWGMI
jgi:nucleoside triphosphate pyrophosphatase